MNSTVEILPLTKSLPVQCVYLDALNYLQVVKSKRPEIYPIFCVKLIDYLLGSGEPFEIVRYAAVTFRGDPDLSSGFRKFLPPDDTIFISMLKAAAWVETLEEPYDTHDTNPVIWERLEQLSTSNNKARKLKTKEKQLKAKKAKPKQTKSKRGKLKRTKSKKEKVKSAKSNKEKLKSAKSKSKALNDVTNVLTTPKKVKNPNIDHAAMYKTRSAIYSPKKVSPLPARFKSGSVKSNSSTLNFAQFELKSIPELDILWNEEEFTTENIIPEDAAFTSNYSCSSKVSWQTLETLDLPMKTDTQSTVYPSIYPCSTQKSTKITQKTESTAQFNKLCYEYNSLIDSLENVKKHFKKRINIYKKFLQILDDYQEEIRGNRMNDDLLMRSMLDIQIHQRICDLFENKMDILPNLDRFIRYLGSVSAKVSDIDKLLV